MKMNSHLALSCLVATVISIAFTQSHAQMTDQSLRAQALMENKVSESQTKNTATDAQVEGMLSLKDPRLDMAPRKVKYFAQLGVQQFKPAGNLRSDLGYNFDLGQNSTTLMPSVSLGLLIPSYSNDSIKTRFGLAGKVSYSSQSAAVQFPSGYTESDVRLNSMLLGINPFVSIAAQRFSWLYLNAGLEFGDFSYTQTSNNQLATFSKHSGYHGWNVGLSFDLSENWSIQTNYAQRKLNDDGSIQLQSNNFELGTQVTW